MRRVSRHTTVAIYPKVIVRDGLGRRHIFTDVTRDELETLMEVVWNYASVDHEITFRGMTLPVLPESELVAVSWNGDIVDTHCSLAEYSCTVTIRAEDLRELLGEVAKKPASPSADNGSSAAGAEPVAQPAREGRSRKRRGRSRSKRGAAQPPMLVDEPASDEASAQLVSEPQAEAVVADDVGAAEADAVEQAESASPQDEQVAVEAPEEPKRRRGRARRRPDRAQAVSEPEALTAAEPPAEPGWEPTAEPQSQVAADAEPTALLPETVDQDAKVEIETTAEPAQMPEAPSAETEVVEEPKKKRTTRRRTKKAAEEAVSEQSGDEQATVAESEQPKPRRRRSQKTTSEQTGEEDRSAGHNTPTEEA